MTEKLLSVFVVDDEPIIAETLTLILQRSGYAAKSFTDPREALIAAHAAAPDLLLSDVLMPDLTGVELAISVRKNFPKCRILLFSGQAGTNDLLAKARQQGYEFPLLQKPLHPVDLLRCLRREGSASA